MQLSRNQDVALPTFHFLNGLQLGWIVWNAFAMSDVFGEAEVPVHFTFLLVIGTSLTCACCVAKMIALHSGSLPLQRVIILGLMGKVIFDSLFCVIVFGATDTLFGLHFYYDLPFVTATISALDTILFPYFVASAHEASHRKEK